MACLKPFRLKDEKGTLVPCMKCPKCIARRISGWSFRLLQEYKVSSSAQFLTLTYDTNNLDELNFKSHGLSLSKRHLQLYFKRLRKAQRGFIKRPIKYYAVGEYGGKRTRPHYHIILFNAELRTVDLAWNKGMVHVGQVNAATVGYCLKYMTKQSQKRNRFDDRVNEFSVMSKGLGASYLTDEIRKYHSQSPEQSSCIIIEGGKKIAMPRYYREKLFNEEKRKQLSEYWREYHIQEMLSEKEYQKFIHLSPEKFIKTLNEKNSAIEAAYQRMYYKANKNRHLKI